MKNYGAHSFGQKPPDVELQHRAIDATKKHSFFQEASAYAYCEPSVFFLEGEQLGVVRKRLPEAFAGLDRALAVSFYTSSGIPKPLFGGGKSYDFILHPESLEILDAGTGSWKS